MYFLAIGLIFSRCCLSCGMASLASAPELRIPPMLNFRLKERKSFHVGDELGFRIAAVELLAGLSRQALGGELSTIVGGSWQGNALLCGQRSELVVELGVLAEHLLAEFLQLGIGGSLLTELTEGQFGKTAVRGRCGEKPVIDGEIRADGPVPSRLILNGLVPICRGTRRDACRQ